MPSAFNNNTNNQEKKPQKPKDERINRSVLLTAIVLVVALIIVATAVIISNKAKVPTPLPDPEPKKETPNTQGKTNNNTQTEPPKDNPSQKPSSAKPTDNKIPSFTLPVSGSLGSTHGPDLQVFSPTMNDYRVHLGIDLLAKDSAPVYAAADGKVSKIWVDPLMGYCLAVEHSGDCVTIYKNLAETLADGIKEGAAVRSGQLIATIGDSAMVEVGSEPHLHFEMTVNDLAVDPLKYFDENTLNTIKKDAVSE